MLLSYQCVKYHTGQYNLLWHVACSPLWLAAECQAQQVCCKCSLVPVGHHTTVLVECNVCNSSMITQCVIMIGAKTNKHTLANDTCILNANYNNIIVTVYALVNTCKTC